MFRMIVFLLTALLLYPENGRCQSGDLDYYIKKGITSSPVIKDLTNQIQVNKCDSLVARAGYLPQVSFNAMLMYAPVVNGWGYSEVITNGQQLLGTMNVNQQFLNKKTREANLRKFGIQGMNLDNTRHISINELKSAITAQYLAAFSAFSQKNYHIQILQSLKEEEEIMGHFVEAGTYRQTDLLTLKVEIMNMERSIKDLDIQYRKEFSNLRIICGITDTTRYPLCLPSISEIPSISGEKSPLLRKFYYDSLRIQNEREMVDSRYKPTVNWFSDGGIVNNLPSDIYKNFGISFGLTMGLPIYDGNQRKQLYAKIKTEEDNRKNYRDYSRFVYESQLKQMAGELNQVRASAAETQKQVETIEELIRQDKVLLNVGSLGINDYILALKSMIEARHNSILYQIRAQYLINEINFLKQ